MIRYGPRPPECMPRASRNAAPAPVMPPSGSSATPVVSTSEIASFTPIAPTQEMEPAGWTAVGLDTNVITHADVHVRNGSLFGLPAEVRFTPVGYDWTYGEGSSLRSDVPGATWQSLRLPEFSRTATSHVYGLPGHYTVELTVRYTAEYRLGTTGWFPVRGTVLVPANDLAVMVLRPKTVLVAEHCAMSSRGPGC